MLLQIAGMIRSVYALTHLARVTSSFCNTEKISRHIDTRARVKQLVLNQHLRSFDACQKWLARVIVTRVVTVNIAVFFWGIWGSIPANRSFYRH